MFSGTMLSRMSVQLKPGQLISIQRSPSIVVQHCSLNAPHHVSDQNFFDICRYFDFYRLYLSLSFNCLIIFALIPLSIRQLFSNVLYLLFTNCIAIPFLLHFSSIPPNCGSQTQTRPIDSETQSPNNPMHVTSECVNA